MGAIILSTGVCTDKALRSSIAHSVEAGKQALARAGVAAEDVALVINTGIYRDQNMAEPSMAALIQKDLGMNPDYIKAGTGKDAFSLDLMNGGIGTLNAFQVANSFLEGGSVRYALILGADAHPSNKDVKEFPYATLGSAVLLGKGKDGKRGFQSFSFESESGPDHGRTGKALNRQMGITGRDHLHLATSADYVQRALAFSSQKTKDFIAQHNIDKTKTRIISSQLNQEFAQRLALGIGAEKEAALDIYGRFGDPHSASFAFGLDQLSKGKALNPGSELLFVGITSGLSFGCVHYVA